MILLDELIGYVSQFRETEKEKIAFCYILDAFYYLLNGEKLVEDIPFVSNGEILYPNINLNSKKIPTDSIEVLNNMYKSFEFLNLDDCLEVLKYEGENNKDILLEDMYIHFGQLYMQIYGLELLQEQQQKIEMLEMKNEELEEILSEYYDLILGIQEKHPEILTIRKNRDVFNRYLN